jgi:hypothetical protein
MPRCQLCKAELQEGNRNNIYGTDEGMRHISRHHLFPKRFRNYFTNDELMKIFQIETPNILGNFCYECHEEVLHNLILNREIIDKLSQLFEGKDKKTRIIIFYEIFRMGIETILKK